jgi:hypothetical protein
MGDSNAIFSIPGFQGTKESRPICGVPDICGAVDPEITKRADVISSIQEETKISPQAYRILKNPLPRTQPVVVETRLLIPDVKPWKSPKRELVDVSSSNSHPNCSSNSHPNGSSNSHPNGSSNGGHKILPEAASPENAHFIPVAKTLENIETRPNKNIMNDPLRAKTTLCKYGLSCDRESFDCFFAHGPLELRVHFAAPTFKKRKCNRFPECPFNDTCMFLHDEMELQINSDCVWCSVLCDPAGNLLGKLHRKKHHTYSCECFKFFDLEYAQRVKSCMPTNPELSTFITESSPSLATAITAPSPDNFQQPNMQHQIPDYFLPYYAYPQQQYYMPQTYLPYFPQVPDAIINHKQPESQYYEDHVDAPGDSPARDSIIDELPQYVEQK